MGLKKIGTILGFLGVLFLEGLVLSTAYNVHHYSFILRETNFTKLCSTKSMLTVNGQWPGPTIHVRKGDRAFVNVHNNGEYGVTIHWHGVKQPRNPWSDGPENITQCPISPGTNFTYEVIFSSEEGTLWWHAHSDWSRATVHGAIIVYPALTSSYPFPEPYAEETIVLGEWYKGDVMAIIDVALKAGNETQISDAYTINGEPGDQYNCSKETMYHLKVNHGKTYLLRIVNAIMNEEQFFAIANHNLTVVGSDGAYTKPINTNYIMITPGQTMDILVTANQSPGRYYIASTPYAESSVDFDNTTTTAILQYSGNYTPSSSIPFPTFPVFNDSVAAESFTKRLRSLASREHPINVPLNITKRIYMTISINWLPCPNASCSGLNGNRIAASLNNVTFQAPTTDILQAYYRKIPNVFTQDFPSQPPYYFNFSGDVDNVTTFSSKGTRVVTLNYNDAVELVYQGTNLVAPENHPMHLHGFSFYVVGIGSGNFNKTTDPKSYNLVDPPEVNTIGVPKNGWLAMRFVADNPGVWFMHCHLERHSSWGMETVFIVKNGGTAATSIRPPPKYMPPCSKS